VDERPKYSRTGQVFQRRRGSQVRVSDVSAEHLEAARARDPGFIPRLGWTCSPKVPTDWGRLTDALSDEGDLAVFCDNSAFDEDAPPELWNALLAEPGRLVLTGRVLRELLPWLRTHRSHPVTRAIAEHHEGIAERLEPKPGSLGRRSFDYYLMLLLSRRAGLAAARRVFARGHGREPDKVEERALLDRIQKDLGQRDRMLAAKGVGNLTDEALVYLAVEHALTSGQQTMVLTRDADVEEQFFKLLWLINTHYRGMLLADHYISHFSEYRTYPVPDNVLLDPNGPFEPHDALIIERHPDLLEVLPPNPQFVGISCLNAGVFSTQLRFCAETEMAKLLQIKEETGGLNTNILGGRNMHASIQPVWTGLGRDAAAIAYDRRRPAGDDGATVAKVDVLQAQFPVEQLAHVVQPTSSTDP
jgi:hypothetical protein